MLRRFVGLRVLSFAVVTAMPLVTVSARAVTILSGPTFTPATNAPLAGKLELTTDVDSRVSVTVNDGMKTWERRFFDYATTHAVPLLGFKPERTNFITVHVQDKYRNSVTAAEPLSFVTDPLPAGFPVITLLKSKPAKMEPGYTLFRVGNNNVPIAFMGTVDSAGEVVWFSRGPTMADVSQLENGNMLTPRTTKFVEYNMLGEVARNLVVPANLRINEHDAFPTDHGTILYISDAYRSLTNFPSNSTNPNASRRTTNAKYNIIVEISETDGSLLHTWSLIDMLDPYRIDYLTFALGVDLQHANAVIEDPRDHALIVSMRHQDAVMKFTRDGQIKWILGPHENWGPAFQPYLLTPVGTPFEWNYAQHACTLTPQGTLLLFDNGNYRASPYDAFVPEADNYSRSVEFSINEETMEVSQLWDYGRTNVDERLTTHAVSNTEWLPKTGNVLVNFGNISFVDGVHPSATSPNASMVRILEVTHEPIPEVVFDLEMFDHSNTSTFYSGYWVYRSHRIPDLYPHPAKPVADLLVHDEDGIPHLEFSGDPDRDYRVEASTNLLDWEEIGLPDPEAEPGNFGFEDTEANPLNARYYRVVTH